MNTPKETISRLANDMQCMDVNTRTLILSFLDIADELGELECMSTALDALKIVSGKSEQIVIFPQAITRFRILLPRFAFLADKGNGEISPYGGQGIIRFICNSGIGSELKIAFVNTASKHNIRLWKSIEQ